jgi:hypothetical protein
MFKQEFMLKKDHFFTGIVAGLVLPLFCLILSEVLHLFAAWNKPAIPYYIALLLNLLAIRYCFKKGFTSTGSGLMLISFIVTLLIYWLKVRQ